MIRYFLMYVMLGVTIGSPVIFLLNKCNRYKKGKK